MVPDVFGWSHSFNARGIQKHSKHTITIKPVGFYTKQDLRKSDVVFFFDLYCLNHIRKIKALWNIAAEKPIILYNCGTYFGKPPPCVTVYAVCTERQVKKCRALGITNYALLREGVDTEIFKPLRGKHSPRVVWTVNHWKKRIDENVGENRPWYYGFPYRWWWGEDPTLFLSRLPSHITRTERAWLKNTPALIVGWAGNPKQKLKRYHLAQQLKYPIKVMAQHGNKYFKPHRSRKPMVQFYNSLDVYVMLMRGNGVHGCGLTLMEAMSCGIPVVATNIAGVSELVPRNWLVADQHDRALVKAVNGKLTLLENASVRKKVGASNRKLILETRSWKINVKEWDSLFTKIIEK